MITPCWSPKNAEGPKGAKAPRWPLFVQVLPAAVALALIFLGSGPARAQTPILGLESGGRVVIQNADLAVLESGEERNDLPCTVTQIKPILGFDLRFHTGYNVTIPLKDLAGSGNRLTIIFRVSAESSPDQPVFFSQHLRVPAIHDGAGGDAYLPGGFDVGEGKYHVDWLMRDRSEQVCSSSWDIEARLPDKDKQISVEIPPGTVARAAAEQFKEEPPVQRASGAAALNVKVLINFAPQNSLSAALQPIDTAALVSILRSLARDPRIGKFSVTAFNMQEQKVIYRQAEAERIDFPDLGKAVRKLTLGTISFQQLSEKHGDTEFLTNLIRQECEPPSHPDALIFAGPKVMLDSDVPADALKDLSALNYPVFYMNYNLNPQAMPWRDAISRVVKFFNGYEYTITRPRDLWFSVSEMVSRIVKSRNGREISSITNR